MLNFRVLKKQGIAPLPNIGEGLDPLFFSYYVIDVLLIRNRNITDIRSAYTL